MSSTTDESAVVQVAANAEAQAAATSKAFPTPSEVSLAQDILALASSALSSSANKADAKDVNADDQEVKVEMAEEYTGPDLDGKPAWAQYLADFQKIGKDNAQNLMQITCILCQILIILSFICKKLKRIAKAP